MQIRELDNYLRSKRTMKKQISKQVNCHHLVVTLLRYCFFKLKDK